MQQCKLYFTLNGKEFNLYFNYIKGNVVTKIEMMDDDDILTPAENMRLSKAVYRMANELKEIFLERASDAEKKYEVMARVQKIMKSL